MILQLNPPIPMTTPKGDGLAHFVIDYSAEFDLHWVIFIDATGECWTFSNKEVRAQKNRTLGRPSISHIEPENEFKKTQIIKGMIENEKELEA